MKTFCPRPALSGKGAWIKTRPIPLPQRYENESRSMQNFTREMIKIHAVELWEVLDGHKMTYTAHLLEWT